MKTFSACGRFGLVVTLSLGALCTLTSIHADAQVITPSPLPILGRSNTFSADPAVVRPDTPPCGVTLFTNLEFADFNTKNFTYTPPKNCPGPWSKVVFKADFVVTPGRQYDRTAEFYLGGANILFGTTPEPRSTVSPDWHVENDVTELSSLLTSPQAGTALIGNFVGVYNGVDYNGIIYSTAQLVFFPASSTAPAPKVPDMVIGIPGNSGAASLNSTSSQLTQVITLPTNVEAAYLDVIAQSQSNDEFWYLCVPNDLASELQSCGNTGFRETEISIDGIPAGVAPVYPWIFTGGIDPYLWEPIPGVQTLNFKPFRVDLTPFAGVLSNGKPHTVAVSEFNADSYFAAEGNLLIYTDKGSTQVTGEVLQNSLTAEPTPVVDENIATDASGNVSGSVKVSSQRKYSVYGNVHTSHGFVYTRVDGTFNFSNTQNFVIDQVEYKQAVAQTTTGNITTTTAANGLTTVNERVLSYPFTFVYDEVVQNDGSLAIANISDQKYNVTSKTFYSPATWASTTISSSGTPAPFVQNVSNEVASSDTLFYDSSFNYTGHAGHSSQNYFTNDSTGYCYSRELTANDLKMVSVVDGIGCSAPVLSLNK
jgi:hypothetical protein